MLTREIECPAMGTEIAATLVKQVMGFVEEERKLMLFPELLLTSISNSV